MNFKEALMAHLQGKKVLCKSMATGNEWWPLIKLVGDATIDLALSDGFATACEFRLAPRTVMIGDAECEAPLKLLKDDQTYWLVAPHKVNDGCVQSYCNTNPDLGKLHVETGFCFATGEAAKAAHAAWVKLMTQP
jgi:hypothetical protein